MTSDRSRVIVLNPAKVFSLGLSSDALGRGYGSVRNLDKKYKNAFAIFDDGSVDVIEAVILPSAAEFSLVDRLAGGIFSPRELQVDRKVVEASFDDFTDIVCEAIKLDPLYNWLAQNHEMVSDEELDIDDVRELVEAATTPSEVFAVAGLGGI